MFAYGAVREEVQEGIRNILFDGDIIPESCISKLTPKAREWVCEFIVNDWEERGMK